MPKIVITEIDETTPGVFDESTDVVYIPGLVDDSQAILYNDDNEYIGLEVNVPTMFTSVSAFESLCGTKPIFFDKDQLYSDLHTTEKTIEDSSGNTTTIYSGFKDYAVPSHGIMFKKGDPDPSYVLAKELLASGLSVVYERLNVPKEDTYQEFSTDNIKYVPRDIYLKNEGTTSQTVDVYKKAFNTSDYAEGEYPTPQSGVVYYYLFQAENEYGRMWLEPTGDYAVPTEEELKDETNPKTINWKSAWKGAAIKDQIILDPGYTLVGDGAISIVSFAGRKLYKKVGHAHNISYIYDQLNTVFDVSNKSGIVDRGNFSVKYLTSGGYPVFEYTDDPTSNNTLATKMLSMAETRGDCIALIDHTHNIERTINPNSNNHSVYEELQDFAPENGEFGSMFTPYITYNRITTDYNAILEDDGYGATKVTRGENVGSSSITAAGSFAYLTSLADSIKTNANWLAIAGVTRGGVRNIGNMVTNICNAHADDMQKRTGVSINAITNIRPYGNVIWGNRTLKDNAENLVATSFLNIRNLVSDVKKTCYRVARSTTFEQDTDVLWMNFKNSIAQTLDRMVSGYGISGYKIVRDNTHYRAKEKATICAKIILYPTYAVEDFYITVVLKDAEVTVE